MTKLASLTQSLEPTAREALESFARIAEAAIKVLARPAAKAPDVFANMSNSTFTGPAPGVAQLAEMERSTRASAEHLRKEPAIARILYRDGDEECVSYVCRASPPESLPGIELVNQRAARGRLAALAVGESLVLQNGKRLEVLERLEVHPFEIASGWDSKDSVVRRLTRGPLTVASLAALLTRAVSAPADFLAQLIAEENQRNLVRDGQKRAILTSMQLRDQPILDSQQDEIFRLPIDQQVFLMGPPGSGKTTTLIRRLGLKLDSQYLTEDEARQVDRATAAATVSHANSWIMFTPTELLRQYVKEAFIRERIPASDQHIKTWIEFRLDAARNNFRILRSARAKRGLVLKAHAETTVDIKPSQLSAFYEAFETWQRKLFLDLVSISANSIQSMSAPRAGEIGRLVKSVCDKAENASLADLVIVTTRFRDDLSKIADELRKTANAPIEGALNRRLNRDRQFLNDLAKHLQQSPLTDDPELDESMDDEDEEEESNSSELLSAVTAYKNALRALSRSRISKKRIRPDSRAGMVLEKIGTDELSDDDLLRIGESLVLLGHLRRLTRIGYSYVYDIPVRYRAFRRAMQRDNKWFTGKIVSAFDINGQELDAVLLASLKAARDILSRNEVRASLNTPSWTYILPVSELYRNQVLADEATDFSQLQLSCMEHLTDPYINSFFAAGDFNQRLNSTGIATETELYWAAPRMAVHKISVLFRQSRRLQVLAQSILGTFTDGVTSADSAADTVGTEVSPVLLEHHGNQAMLAKWLADRIREIESSLGQLPTIAVFVPEEKEIEPLSEELNGQFREDNLRALPCVLGQIIGHDTDVRVFDIQHIKGLEFEAAFFVGIDVVAQQFPTDFARYLYVGATRAATYLGVTCKKELPPSIAALRSQFEINWIS